MWLENAQTLLFYSIVVTRRCVFCSHQTVIQPRNPCLCVVADSYAAVSQSRRRATSAFLNILACAVIVQQELVCLRLSFSLLTSILKPWMSGMPESCDEWVALGNAAGLHAQQVTMTCQRKRHSSICSQRFRMKNTKSYDMIIWSMLISFPYARHMLWPPRPCLLFPAACVSTDSWEAYGAKKDS